MTPALTTEPLVLHEDIFYEYFMPYRHPETESNVWGGLGLETFGKDFQLILLFDKNHVWTVIDGGDNPNQWIVPGVHHVNRICHLVTRIPHNWFDVEFLVPYRNRSLTLRGKTIQIKRLEKNMNALRS